jgi:hypothetical protein
VPLAGVSSWPLHDWLDKTSGVHQPTTLIGNGRVLSQKPSKPAKWASAVACFDRSLDGLDGLDGFAAQGQLAVHSLRH